MRRNLSFDIAEALNSGQAAQGEEDQGSYSKKPKHDKVNLQVTYRSAISL